MDFISKSFVNRLHKGREAQIDRALKKFRKQYWDNLEEEKKLKEKLEREADRLYPMVDKSIARSEVNGAVKTAGITGGIGLLAALLIGAPWFIPIIAAVAVFGANLYKIPEKYNSRIEGGLDSVVSLHIKELQEKKMVAPAPAPDIKKELAVPVLHKEKPGRKAGLHEQRYLDRKEKSRSWAGGVAPAY